MDIDFSHILTQIIAFLIMFWILKKFGWTRLLNLLQERKQFIQSELDTATAERKTVEQLREEYANKLLDIEFVTRVKIKEAISEGQRIAREIQDEAQAEARAIFAKTKVEIQEAINNANNQLRNELVNMVVMATEKIIKQKLDEETHKKLIHDFVQEAETK